MGVGKVFAIMWDFVKEIRLSFFQESRGSNEVPYRGIGTFDVRARAATPRSHLVNVTVVCACLYRGNGEGGRGIGGQKWG